MKLMSDIAKKIKDSYTDEKPVLCEYVTTTSGMIKLSTPVLSSEHVCSWCSGKEHYSPLFDPKTSSARTWLCANPDCEVYKIKTKVKVCLPISQQLNALGWALFCEMNGLGDLDHNVRFEDLQQDAKKVAYMLKFAAAPRGILYMQGNPGTGKTFAAMAICELFIRKSKSCIFTTQKQMSNNWLATFKADKYDDYIDRISRVNLLVIDDFGVCEPPAGFLSMFMDVINLRLKWSDRGTIVTTNLSAEKFNLFCGEALVDRFKTGMLFKYDGKSKRKQNIL